MILLPLLGLWEIFRRLVRQPAFRGLVGVELLLILGGAAFYHNIEQWSWLDSIYFCVVTLATVGYGDFSPSTPWGRLFAIPYIILGVALLGVFIQIAGKTALEELQAREEKKRLKDRANQQETAENKPDEK